MPKKGRPIRLVNAYAEYHPIEQLGYLPEMRGIYILYDKNRIPLYCGRAGKGRNTIRSRIMAHKSRPYLRRKIRYFSVYDVDCGYMHQIETILLRAFGDLMRWNTYKGKFLKGAIEVPCW
jgi:hypothetical protein